MPDIGKAAVGASSALTDRFGRTITYLRLAVTDRCNLRCTYCMPAKGVVSLNHAEILTFEEMARLVRLLVRFGVRKVRITGGEPFVRQGLVAFLGRLSAMADLDELHLTTNGVETADYIPQLEALGLAGINLSLDTLDAEKFKRITRRDRFAEVRRSLDALLRSTIPLKINTVVKFGLNDDEIFDIASLAREHPIHVRFIEEMPFNGDGRMALPATNHRIEKRLKALFPGIVPEAPKGTAQLFIVPGFCGRIGIICGVERTFCHTCNRLRITADGTLKTCLYDRGVLDLRALLRRGATDQEIGAAIRQAVHGRPIDGHAAELTNHRGKTSMVQIGG